MDKQFRTADELADWLESLNETTADGRITNTPWEPAQRAARAVREAVPDEAKALAAFTEYFVRNYPGPHTIIGDPNWHAPRIFRAAKYALAAAPTQDQENGS